MEVAFLSFIPKFEQFWQVSLHFELQIEEENC